MAKRLEKLVTRGLHIEPLEQRSMLATLVVTSILDNPIPVNDGIITLREAVAYINQDAAAGSADAAQFDVTTLGQNDKIVFDESLFGAADPDGIRRAEIELEHLTNKNAGDLSVVEGNSALWIKNSVEMAAADGFEMEISLQSGLIAPSGGNQHSMRAA